MKKYNITVQVEWMNKLEFKQEQEERLSYRSVNERYSEKNTGKSSDRKLMESFKGRGKAK